MEPTTSSHQVLICRTCGDEGFTNAFVYCVKCLGFVVHRYCLDVMPRTFDEIVLWFCEDCKRAVPNQFALPKITSSRSGKEEVGSARATYPKKKQKKERDIASLIAGTEEVCREHTTEPDVECIQLTDSLLRQRKKNGLVAKKKERELQDNLKHGVQKGCTKTVDSIEHSWSDNSPTTVNVKNTRGVASSVEEPRDVSHLDKRLELSEHEKSLSVSGSSSMKKESDKKANNEFQAEVANQMQAKQDIGTSKSCTDVSISADFANDVQHNHYLLAQPVIDPIWRGSFKISNTGYDLFEGFVAHLSNNACDKVCEEANTLPSLLCLEMHPKTVLWPKSFHERVPSDENIALYFFPGDTKNERAFDHLVIDMMDEGLAMRTTTQNAELLIFTSKVLPRLSWRFKGKYFLWGVFRGKRNDSLPPVSPNITALNYSDNCCQSNNSPNIVVNGKKAVTRVKTLDARSPDNSLHQLKVR